MVNKPALAIRETKRSWGKISIVSGWKEDKVVSPLSEQASGDRLFCEIMTQYVCVAVSYICIKCAVCFVNEGGEIWEVRW